MTPAQAQAELDDLLSRRRRGESVDTSRVLVLLRMVDGWSEEAARESVERRAA